MMDNFLNAAPTSARRYPIAPTGHYAKAETYWRRMNSLSQTATSNLDGREIRMRLKPLSAIGCHSAHMDIKRILVFTVAAIGFSLSSFGAPLTFDFKDPKGVNTVIFKTDAPLESINGTAHGVSGMATFDPENPAGIRGKIVVAASSLHVPNPTMKEHMHGDNWLNVAKHPEITFEVVSTGNAKTEGNATTLEVTGNMTIKGVTKSLTVPVKLTYLKDKLKARGGPKEGDLLVLRSTFNIKRSDFGINAAKFEDKVSNEIELTFSLAGASPRG